MLATKNAFGSIRAWIQLCFPSFSAKNVNISIKGEQEENEKVQREMAQAAIIAMVLIFMALIWMFDSILKPLIILSTIPLSILGVLLGHLIMDINITMMLIPKIQIF